MQANLDIRRFAEGVPRRRQAGRAGMFSPVRPATFLASALIGGCVPAPVFAAEAAPAAADVAAALLGSWLVQLSFVLTLLLLGLKIWDYLRPKPPLHQQYAPIKHTHAELHSSADADTCRANQTREMMTIRQEMGGMTGKVERQIDHLRDAVTTQNAQIVAALKDFDEKQEDRIRRIHGRIDPLAERVAANKQAIEQHIADERAKAQNSNHHGG